jgi:lipopolysaccharide transport system permease protein
VTRSHRVIRIDPPGRWHLPPLAEMVEHRELLLLLAWRDLKVRYKQTALGALWAVLQPLLVILLIVTTLGVTLYLAALNVRYRDVRYVVPFLTQLWLFATPVAYSTNLLHGRWRAVAAINPMTGVAQGFRWSILGTNVAVGPLLAISTVTALIALGIGLAYFARVERTFADVV